MFYVVRVMVITAVYKLCEIRVFPEQFTVTFSMLVI